MCKSAGVNIGMWAIGIDGNRLTGGACLSWINRHLNDADDDGKNRLTRYMDVEYHNHNE